MENIYSKIQGAVSRTLFGRGIDADSVRATRSAVSATVEAERQASTHAEAADQARAAADQAERDRLDAILRSPEASSHWEQALQLALDTDLPAAAARQALRDQAPSRLPGLAYCNGHDLGPNAEAGDTPDAEATAHRILDEHRSAWSRK